MIVRNIKLKNFRCFSDFQLNFDNKFVVLEGNNGTGKTSILEALYYACYLRSFRTRTKNELISFSQNHFFIQVDFDEEIDPISNQIQIGYSRSDGKSVKLNKKSISSFKDIISRYKVIALVEDDLQLIVGAPEFRRAYLNQSLFLLEPDLIDPFKEYKRNLDQRNKFLFINSNNKISGSVYDELYSWTKLLWEKTVFLQNKRIELLNKIQKSVNIFLQSYFKTLDQDISIELTYARKNMNKNKSEETFNVVDSFDLFWKKYELKLMANEMRWQRSLFGIHLDDFYINFKNKRARFFASRGQQKLILFLLKIAQLIQIQGSETGILLLDDFITDFDIKRLVSSISLLKDQQFQSFITSPIESLFHSRLLKDKKLDFDFFSIK